MNKGWAAICRFGGIGDNLIAADVLPLLARKYQGVEVFSEKPNSVVFENNPHIAKLTTKDIDTIPKNNQIDLQRYFADKATEYDLFVNLSHSCETRLALQYVQYEFQWPAAWRREHCGRNYLEFVHDIVRVPHIFDRLFFPTDEEVEKALLTKKNLNGSPLIGWVISGSRLDKRYPYAGQVIARLISELGASVLLLGAPSTKDMEAANQIGRDVEKALGSTDKVHAGISPEPTTHWKETEPGKRLEHIQTEAIWPVRRVLTQLKYCDIAIGPDTGPMWAVAMEDIPKVCLLSHASPENITKHWRHPVTLHADQRKVDCWPCHQLHDEEKTCRMNAEKTAPACMSNISAETVVSAVRRLINPSPET